MGEEKSSLGEKTCIISSRYSEPLGLDSFMKKLFIEWMCEEKRIFRALSVLGEES